MEEQATESVESVGNPKLFVSNLDFELKPEDIKGVFSDIGTVITLTLVTDRETGRSRGYCFIEMASAEEAAKAIEGLNGKVINGRPISVAEDRGKKSTSPSGSPRGRDGKREPREFLQPMQRVLFVRRKRRTDIYLDDPNLKIDYRDIKTLSRFMSERGRIMPRRLTGLNSYNQRKVAKAIKRAQNVGLLPFTAVMK